MKRNVALLFLAAMGAALISPAAAVSWVGNTTLYENGHVYPKRGAYIETGQSMTIVTQSWPITNADRVTAVVTTNNFATTQEYVFTYDFRNGNNSQWYCVLPSFPKNTHVQFYLRGETWQGATAFDNNGGANYSIFVRSSPNYRDGAILQWFETDYKTILRRLPEVVLTGYSAIYVPAPTKAPGATFSVGYNPLDLFDLGDRQQGGNIRTKYGTAQELQELIRACKRLGIEIYCDTVLNHFANRAENPINQYPTVIPEDFHIRSSADTTNPEIDFNTAGAMSSAIFNQDLVGLADIAHEDGNAAQTGPLTLPPYASWNMRGKPSFVRSATTPQFYPGGVAYAEDVRQMQKRWMWWMTTKLGFDGYRLDAIKHMPPPYLGYAPDQVTNGMNFSEGDVLNYSYSLNNNLYFFGEDFTSNTFELNQYAKTGQNLLDFPLFFNFQSIFNSQGFGNISAALSNGYGVDANGLPFERGGLAPSVGVGFVQSHDSGPPESNNLAHAFLLTRTGRPKIYYDGNNIQPGNWSNFPRPGREDSLGTMSDVVPRLLDVKNRFVRGGLVNRVTTGNTYIYERQVNGKATLLVGLNIRSDVPSTGNQTFTVQTAFPAGTVLEDLAGRMGNVTVGGDSRVQVTVPSNAMSDTQPGNNGRGYVLYAPIAPKALPGVRAVTLGNPASAPTRTVDYPVNTEILPKGTFGQLKSFEAYRITGDTLHLGVRVDGLGDTAFARFDDGVLPPGQRGAVNTSEGLANGWIQLDKSAAGVFRRQNVRLDTLADGLHTVRVRVFRNNGSGAAIFNDFVTFFYLNRSFRGESVEGFLEGIPLAMQSRTASSNNNRMDALYVNNDENYLYVGVAGRVDGSENFTNGMMVWMDANPGDGQGFTNFSQLRDDSGPAPRLLSNRKITAPSGFAADLGIAMLRNWTLNNAPESPIGGGLATPFPVGAFSGAFRFDTAKPWEFAPIPTLLSYQARNQKTEPARGMEVAIPLSSVWPNGVPTGPTIGFVTGLGTTGEAGTVLQSSNAQFSALGGRPAPNPYMTNQFLPSQSSVTGDPGTGNVTLNSFANYVVRQASETPASSYTITMSPDTTRLRTDETVLDVTLTANATLIGPVSILVNAGNNLLVNRSAVSLRQPGWQGIRASGLSMTAGQKVNVQLRFRGSNLNLSPTFVVRNGVGLY
jgi:glycosidase